MSCDITKGRLEPCKDSIGGLKNIYVVNYDEGLFEDAVITDSELTAITDLYDAFKFELRGENSYEEAGQTDRQAGTTFYETTATLVLKKQDKATQNELKLLAIGRPHIIFEDYNGNKRLFGLENGGEVAVTPVSGANMEDLNGYNLEVTFRERDMAPFVDPTLIGTGVSAGFKVGV